MNFIRELFAVLKYRPRRGPTLHHGIYHYALPVRVGDRYVYRIFTHLGTTPKAVETSREGAVKLVQELDIEEAKSLLP